MLKTTSGPSRQKIKCLNVGRASLEIEARAHSLLPGAQLPSRGGTSKTNLSRSAGYYHFDPALLANSQKIAFATLSEIGGFGGINKYGMREKL